MELRTVRRGFAALAIATVLGLAGAYPAAAADLGLLERGLRWFSGLWSAEDAAVKAGSEDSGWFSFWADESVESRLGIDPNGQPQSGGIPPPPNEGQ